ncbi:uncharacterized protein [Euphorbia lathyris]|uniref:uncharacterized protein n=1 Tax=Euphorbia lathyris TaxID=212925 RepID=UPI00331449AE
MKGTCTLVASMLAASTVALSSSPGDRAVAFYPSAIEGSASTTRKQSEISSEKGKFSPRFDGLRFIETLITAHR